MSEVKKCTQFVTHHTYTGEGCAICGKSEKDHVKEEEANGKDIQAGPTRNGL